MSSRKRKYSPAANVLAVYRPPASAYKRRKRTPFVRGADRVGGYYGRYAGRDAELKFFDLEINDAVVAGGGGLTDSINKIDAGTGKSQRIGRKCTIRQIHVRYEMNIPEFDASATPEAPDTLRFIVYMDKQANGATAAVTDILETANWLSFRNLANSGRFQILVDKNHSLNYGGLASDNAGVVSSGLIQRSFTWSKMCNIPLEFNGVTGAIGEIRSNNVGVLVISAAGKCQFNSKWRVRFSDQG